MIKLIETGTYTLVETKGHTKILTLDSGRTYAWVNAAGIGELLVSSQKAHAADQVLAVGRYRMYDVKREKELTDLVHLELLVGDGIWQGYLLPTGLPDEEDRRNRIIPTREIITKATH